MSQSQLYGFAPYELKPGPDFTAGSDETGRWTGSQTFTCRKFDFTSTIIQNKIKKGNTATSLYPELDTAWDFLRVDSYRHEHQPGGITKIFIQYVGSPEDSIESSENKEESYTLSANMTERDMFDHPYFIGVSQVESVGILGVLKGTARVTSEAGVTPVIIADNYSGYTWEISSTLGLEMFDTLITRNETTYPAPAVEWTIQKTNKAGISAEDLSGLGYIAVPPGSPPTFSGRNWMFTGATMNRSGANPNTVKTWSKTYTLSPPGKPYRSPMFDKP